MTDHPDAFKAGQIRTLQRRIKIWRSDAAHRFVFGDEAASEAELPEAEHPVPALSEAP